MNKKVESLLNSLLDGTGLNFSIIISSELDWKVGPKGVYILCEYGNHHYLANEAEINDQGYLEEKRIKHKNNMNRCEDSIDLSISTNCQVISSSINSKLGVESPKSLLSIPISLNNS